MAIRKVHIHVAIMCMYSDTVHVHCPNRSTTKSSTCNQRWSVGAVHKICNTSVQFGFCTWKSVGLSGRLALAEECLISLFSLFKTSA